MNAAAKPYRGGRVDDMPADEKQHVRYTCFAERCPMPGTIFPDSSRQGVCAWHYAVPPSEIPKVTERLLAWQCVASEVDAARRVLGSGSDPKAEDEAFRQAWARLEVAVQHTGWTIVLAPQQGQGYGEWRRCLEEFIGARVLEVRSVNQQRIA